MAFVWIPARTGFRLHRPPCDFDVTLDFSLASLTKYKHVVLFGIFFLMTRMQLARTRYASLVAAAATLAVGVLIELEEGATGTGYCKLVDLFPATPSERSSYADRAGLERRYTQTGR